MFRKSIYFIIIILCLPVIAHAEGTFFSVMINPHLQNARIGLNMGNLHPFVGLDYLSVGAKVTLDMTMTYYDWYYGTYDEEEVSAEVEAKASLIMPTIGFKYYLSPAAVKPYLIGSFLKSFPSVEQLSAIP